MPRRARLSEAAKTIRQNWCMALLLAARNKQGTAGWFVWQNLLPYVAQLFVRHIRFICPWPGCMSIPKCNPSAVPKPVTESTISSLQRYSRLPEPRFTGFFFCFFFGQVALCSQSVVRAEAEARAARARTTNRHETLSRRAEVCSHSFRPRVRGRQIVHPPQPSPHRPSNPQSFLARTYLGIHPT
ncbi:hypothetical protein MGG_16752 [Pyricularia oryzae 70-15]|uniref:Uncharacterized protein n=1 Tax=Pyricularia oryzae (strain 70-15 / ATCC MYA-4617 / FGSC 8958) TaxID=242507 RepID=G4N552_PYRO7|nr:uncharacterized protein MGG_16752 [Pyricularia oryzae 70-15]EHA52110.1 hypothetical protein MGG_16752 [Pyricularia oryzae 70-15]